MSVLRVQVDAAKTNRSLTAQAPAKRRVRIDLPLLFWRRLIDTAFADAKRTSAGYPTHLAVLQRWWIEEHRPAENERPEWERSFECACKWLNVDVAEERKRLLLAVDEAWRTALLDHARAVVYVRRAQALSCAGMPVAIARQNVLPLVSESEYEDVAGVEHGDPPAVALKLAVLRAA